MTFNSLYNLVVENSMSRSFSCLMLDLSFLREDWAKIQENICPCEIYDEPGYGLENEPHVTVKYGLHEEKASNILPQLELKPIKFKLAGISFFNTPRYDVFKFTIVSPDLMALNKKVCENFTYTDEFPKYIPHATIAYLKKGAGKFYKNTRSKLFGKEFTSNRFIFSDPSSQKVFLTI